MQLQAFLPFRIARLASKTSAAISKIYGERFGLSRDEWRVLAAAGEAEVQPTRAVAEQTGLDKVAISRAASSLEDRGLIQRSEDRRDRRIKMLRLSPAGARMLEEIERLVRAREAFLLEGLSLEEREAFDRMVATLAERAETLAEAEAAEAAGTPGAAPRLHGRGEESAFAAPRAAASRHVALSCAMPGLVAGE